MPRISRQYGVFGSKIGHTEQHLSLKTWSLPTPVLNGVHKKTMMKINLNIAEIISSKVE